MTAPNYESHWWSYIYDQMMVNLQHVVDDNLRFYRANLQDVTGPILECACGTGLFLLPLLADGYNMVGFDISSSMLATLTGKAAKQGVPDIAHRLSIQAFESFHYDQHFAAILIPTNTFAMLTTQDAQLQTLRNIYHHLAPGGKFLLDFRLTGLRDLVEHPDEIQGRWHTWTHPETNLPIRQRIVGRLDLDQHLTLDRCFIEYEGEAVDFPMTARWLFRDEFQLLLRLAGFTEWECFATPDRDPLVVGLDEIQSYWIAYKR